MSIYIFSKVVPIYMSNRHMKNAQHHFKLGKMQIKTTVTYNLTPGYYQKDKKIKKHNVMWIKGNSSDTVGGNVNRFSHYGKYC